MSTGLVEVMKEAAKGVMDSSKLADVRLGRVVTANPVSIRISPDTPPIPRAALVIPEHLTDYETTYSFTDPANLQTFTTWDMSESSESEAKKISFQGGAKLKIKIFNALKEGDAVILLRQQGGKKYIVLDRAY